jgi:hypothetical protein
VQKARIAAWMSRSGSPRVVPALEEDRQDHEQEARGATGDGLLHAQDIGEGGGPVPLEVVAVELGAA